jgi:hypothetical protein
MGQQLALNQVFTLKVVEIKQAAETFSKNGSGGTMYCHFYMLADDSGETFPSQMCTEYPTQNICNTGDMVKAQVKAFTKGRYTIAQMEPIRTTAPEQVKMQEHYVPSPHTDIKQGIPVNQTANPNIAGTINDRAMTLAISYYKDNEVPFEKVTDYADLIKAWFIKQMK